MPRTARSGTYVVGVNATTSRLVANHALTSVLDNDERSHYEALFPQERSDWLSGRIAVREAFARYARRHGLPTAIRIAYRPTGQPYLPEAGGLHCSVSHSAGWGIAAVSAQPVGVDIERSRPHAASLLHYLIDPRERELLLQSMDSAQALTSAWTIKEATAKLLGTGLRFHPRALRIEGRSATGFVVIPREPAPESGPLHVQSFSVDGFALAIATESLSPRRRRLGWYRPPRL